MRLKEDSNPSFASFVRSHIKGGVWAHEQIIEIASNDVHKLTLAGNSSLLAGNYAQEIERTPAPPPHEGSRTSLI